MYCCDILQLTGPETTVKVYNKSGKIEHFLKEEKTTIVISI